MSDIAKRLDEFKKFYSCLMQAAPPGYVPWLFPLSPDIKEPADDVIKRRSSHNCPREQRTSWTAPHARLKCGEVLKLIEKGYNIGISARAGDPLVLVDVDFFGGEKELKSSLWTRSRSRIGAHGYYFTTDTTAKRNITTDKGECRSVDQYVVCPGSYVPTNEAEIKEKISKGELSGTQGEDILKDQDRGYYTVLNPGPVASIVFEELPQFFKDKVAKIEALIEAAKNRPPREPPKCSNGRQSALYSLRLPDFVYVGKKRDKHPLHDSDTGTNFSITGDLGQCWRHLVSLNAIQFLCVKAGYLSCEQAGCLSSEGYPKQ